MKKIIVILCLLLLNACATTPAYVEQAKPNQVNKLARLNWAVDHLKEHLERGDSESLVNRFDFSVLELEFKKIPLRSMPSGYILTGKNTDKIKKIFINSLKTELQVYKGFNLDVSDLDYKNNTVTLRINENVLVPFYVKFQLSLVGDDYKILNYYLPMFSVDAVQAAVDRYSQRYTGLRLLMAENKPNQKELLAKIKLLSADEKNQLLLSKLPVLKPSVVKISILRSLESNMSISDSLKHANKQFSRVADSNDASYNGVKYMLAIIQDDYPKAERLLKQAPLQLQNDSGVLTTLAFFRLADNDIVNASKLVKKAIGEDLYNPWSHVIAREITKRQNNIESLGNVNLLIQSLFDGNLNEYSTTLTEIINLKKKTKS